MKIKNEQKQFKLMLALFATLFLGVVVMVTVLFIFKEGELNLTSIMSIIIGLLIIGFASYLIIRRKKEIEHGIPQHDERSRKIMNLAAARAFYISIYWLLAIMWFNLIFQKINFESNSFIGIAIGGMGIIWGACHFYYNKYGDKQL